MIEQPHPRIADKHTMTIEFDPWGGIVVRWLGADAWLLIDGTRPEAWFVWCGRPVRRWDVAQC